MTVTGPRADGAQDTATLLARPAPTATGWVVTARHRSSAAIKPPEPFGSWHARRPGDVYTACGLPAAGWPIFWHLTHVQGRTRTCAECQAVMYSGRLG